MTTLIDVFGAFVLGGIFLASLFNLNMTISNSNWETTLDLTTQQNCVTTSQIVENDFYKIGWGDTSLTNSTVSPITYADTSKITFRCDIDNDGKIDSITYYAGSTAALSSTTNPRDRLLYRIVNNKVTPMNVGCTNFKLTYYDSAGATTNILKKIKALRVVLDFESKDPNQDRVYAGLHWEQYIVPKTLHY